MHLHKKGFTLVELIVVITILAILWTIAFISLQWYAKDARDSVRIQDVANIKKSLELLLQRNDSIQSQVMQLILPIVEESYGNNEPYEIVW